MPAMEQLCHLLGIQSKRLSFQENIFLEMELFIRICMELKKLFEERNIYYFSLINIGKEKEEDMIECQFLRYVIEDILLTEEYSLSGIAFYTQIPEDVICDITTGKNKYPSFEVSRKIVELHKKVRPDIYKEVVKKISADLCA